MAYAEPDTSSWPSLNHWRCGQLKHIMTTWIQTHKSVPYIWPTHYTTEVIVTAWTSRSHLGVICLIYNPA